MRPERAWVRLESGRRLDLLQPDPDSWTDRDLAIGLSRTYRWGGHSCWDLPLSVAQHSLLVLVLRQKITPLDKLTRGEARRELLHDADEGMLSFDPISPLKPHLGADYDSLVSWFRVDRGRVLRIGRFGPLEQPPPLLGRGGQGTPGLLCLELRLTHSDGGSLLRRIALRAGRCDFGRRGSPIRFRGLAHDFRCFLRLFRRQLGGGASGVIRRCVTFGFGDGLPDLGQLCEQTVSLSLGSCALSRRAVCGGTRFDHLGRQPVAVGLGGIPGGVGTKASSASACACSAVVAAERAASTSPPNRSSARFWATCPR